MLYVYTYYALIMYGCAEQGPKLKETPSNYGHETLPLRQ